MNFERLDTRRAGPHRSRIAASPATSARPARDRGRTSLSERKAELREEAASLLASLTDLYETLLQEGHGDIFEDDSETSIDRMPLPLRRHRHGTKSRGKLPSLSSALTDRQRARRHSPRRSERADRRNLAPLGIDDLEALSKLAPGTSLADLLSSVQQQQNSDVRTNLAYAERPSRAVQHKRASRLAKINEIDQIDEHTIPVVVQPSSLSNRHRRRPRSAGRRRATRVKAKRTRRKRPKSARASRARTMRKNSRRAHFGIGNMKQRRVYNGENEVRENASDRPRIKPEEAKSSGGRPEVKASNGVCAQNLHPRHEAVAGRNAPCLTLRRRLRDAKYLLLQARP